jgi:hypothetical protein
MLELCGRTPASANFPILIPGVQEPEEMRVPPVSMGGSELTPPERELADATKNFSKVNDPNALPAINQILSKFPDFADGYLFRLGFLCDGNDRQAALSDVNNAIKFEENSRTSRQGARS